MTNIKFINADHVELRTVGSPEEIQYTMGSESSPLFTCSSNIFSKNDGNYYHFAITGQNVQLSGVIGEVTSKQQYFKLFEGCSAITDASQLQLTGTVMKESCYSNMFMDCVNLKTSPTTLPAQTLALWCYSGMFAGCSSLSTAPQLPATTLAPYCYYAMFYGCSNLSSSPYLPAETLVDWCYNSMFYNCTSLNKINCNFSAWNGNATSSWVTNVARGGLFINDNVEEIYSNSNIPNNWNDYNTIPLTFIALEPTNTIEIIHYGGNFLQNVKYKKNDEDWKDFKVQYGQLLTGTVIELNANQTVSFSGNLYGMDTLTYNNFVMTGKFKARGNIQSLRLFSNSVNNYEYFRLFKNCSSLITTPILPVSSFYLTVGCYREMFMNCTSLKTAPVLPAIEIAGECYQEMFRGCTSLTAAPPQLPATTLAPSCYYNMFRECSTLLTAPSILPATELASACYMEMFYSCSALTQAPALPASTLANSCYQRMFDGCTSLTAAPELPATILAPSCYEQMFAFAPLTSAPALPATTLARRCYGAMFWQCTSLLEAPQLPATTLAYQCYSGMFYDCSKLSSITVNFTDWKTMEGDNSTSNWVSGVKGGGIFNKPTALSTKFDDSHIPPRWTVNNID